MIAIVYLPQQGCLDRIERTEFTHLDAVVAQAIEKGIRSVHAADAIVDHPYRNALLAFFDQQIGKFAPQLIVGKYIGLYVNGMLCRLNGRADRFESSRSVDE